MTAFQLFSYSFFPPELNLYGESDGLLGISPLGDMYGISIMEDKITKAPYFQTKVLYARVPVKSQNDSYNKARDPSHIFVMVAISLE